MTQLAQAYIHLKPYEASDERVRALGRYAKRVAVKAASEIYGGGVEVEVQLEEGSLRARITVGGFLLVTYGVIADYNGFKESIVGLCSDAREFAVDVCDPFVSKAGVPAEEVYRFERRLKTPGKLYRLTKRLDKLEKSVDSLSPNAVRRELAGLRAELDSLGKHLSETEREALQPMLKRPKLPPPQQWPDPEEAKVAVRRDDDEEQPVLFVDVSGSPQPDQKRRVVFQETAPVPRGKKRRRSRQISARSDLLS